MNNTVKQLQASYNMAEDRILLKLRTDESQFQAWITRRYMQLLIPALHGQHPTTKESLLPEKTRQMHSMQTQSASETFEKQRAEKVEYETPEDVEEPLGSDPILLAKLTFRGLESDNPTISFEPDSGKGFNLSFQPQITSALVQIFSQALAKSDWGLNIDPILDVPEQVTLQ